MSKHLARSASDIHKKQQKRSSISRNIEVHILLESCVCFNWAFVVRCDELVNREKLKLHEHGGYKLHGHLRRLAVRHMWPRTSNKVNNSGHIIL